MLKLEFNCQSNHEAKILLEAVSMYSLINDFVNHVRSQQKHGDDEGLLKLVDDYYAEFNNIIFKLED